MVETRASQRGQLEVSQPGSPAAPAGQDQAPEVMPIPQGRSARPQKQLLAGNGRRKTAGDTAQHRDQPAAPEPPAALPAEEDDEGVFHDLIEDVDAQLRAREAPAAPRKAKRNEVFRVPREEVVMHPNSLWQAVTSPFRRSSPPREQPDRPLTYREFLMGLGF